MADSNEKLSPNASPKIMEVKTKRARRINNCPVFIAFVVVGVIILTLGMVVVSRSNKAKAEIGKTTIKPANAYAKELTAMARRSTWAQCRAVPARDTPGSATV